MRTALFSLLLVSCVVVPDPALAPGGQPLLPPAGFGTLREGDVTITLAVGDVQVRVTPLEESVIRTTAPDTERRLRGIADAYRAEAEAGAGPEATLFLVSFFSLGADVSFNPDDLHIVSRNARLRAAAILPVTPGWGRRRLRQRETETAVYVFGPGVDLESELAVLYGMEESRAWTAILPRIQAERSRARARAGVSGG